MIPDPTGIALGLSLLVWGGNVVNAKTDHDKREVSEQARTFVRDAKKAAAARRDAARKAGDRVREAEAQALISEISALERRTNLWREARKIEEASAAFRRKGQEGLAPGELWGVLMDGFAGALGKPVTETGKMLFGAATVPGWEESPAAMRDIYARLLRHQEDYVALPDKLGDYLARETYRRVLRDNAQLAGSDPAQVFAFVCDQAQRELSSQLREVVDQGDVEVILAAQKQLCQGGSASGTLEFTGMFHPLNRWLVQRQLRMSFKQGAEVTGTLEVEVDVPRSEMTQLVQDIGEAAGGAAAGGLGSTKNKPAEELDCSARGTLVFRLEGTHDGERTMKGKVSLLHAQSRVTTVCNGEASSGNLGAIDKGIRRFEAVDNGADVSVDIEFGMFAFKGDIARR